MFSYIRNNIITIREAIGLDIHFSEQDKMQISGVILKVEKGSVKKIKDIERVATWKELSEMLPKNVPVAATLNGKGILVRENERNITENLISSLFPGTNPNDFVYTTHRITDEPEKIYMARKVYIEDIVKEMNKTGIRLVSLTLGSGAIETALPFMNKWEIQVITPTLLLNILNRKVQLVKSIVHDSKAYKEIEIGQDRYRTSQVLGLGAGLSILSRPADKVHSDIRTTEINYLQKDYVYYKLFRFAGWATLITLLCLLLVNFFVFNHYFNKNKQLVQNNNLVNNQYNRNSAANAQLDSSYNFFMKSGWDKTTKHGYYIDRIAALVPPSVSLTGIQIAPLQESIGMNDYLFQPDKIILAGHSIDPTELETFSRAIRNINGVKSVTIKSYLYKAEISAAIFTIEVNIAT